MWPGEWERNTGFSHRRTTTNRIELGRGEKSWNLFSVNAFRHGVFDIDPLTSTERHDVADICSDHEENHGPGRYGARVGLIAEPRLGDPRSSWLSVAGQHG